SRTAEDLLRLVREGAYVERWEQLSKVPDEYRERRVQQRHRQRPAGDRGDGDPQTVRAAATPQAAGPRAQVHARRSPDPGQREDGEGTELQERPEGVCRGPLRGVPS